MADGCSSQKKEVMNFPSSETAVNSWVSPSCFIIIFSFCRKGIGEGFCERRNRPGGSDRVPVAMVFALEFIFFANGIVDFFDGQEVRTKLRLQMECRKWSSG